MTKLDAPYQKPVPAPAPAPPQANMPSGVATLVDDTAPVATPAVAREPTVVIVRERSAKPFGLSLSGDVVTVAPGSLAAEAGFRSGDKLLTVDGKVMKSTDALMTYLGKVKVGQTVVFTRVAPAPPVAGPSHSAGATPTLLATKPGTTVMVVG